MKKVANIMILSPTSVISHHHRVTNITMSLTSLSPYHIFVTNKIKVQIKILKRETVFIDMNKQCMGKSVKLVKNQRSRVQNHAIQGDLYFRLCHNPSLDLFLHITTLLLANVLFFELVIISSVTNGNVSLRVTVVLNSQILNFESNTSLPF